MQLSQEMWCSKVDRFLTIQVEYRYTKYSQNILKYDSEVFLLTASYFTSLVKCIVWSTVISLS